MKNLKILIASVSILCTTITACGSGKSEKSHSSFDDPLFQELMEIEANSLADDHAGITYETSLIASQGSTSKAFYFKKLQDKDYEECFIHRPLSSNQPVDYPYEQVSADYFINDYYIEYTPGNLEKVKVTKSKPHSGLANFAYSSLVSRVLYCPTSVFTTTKQTYQNGTSEYRLDFTSYKEIYETFVDYYIAPKSLSLKVTTSGDLVQTGYISFSMGQLIFTGSFKYDYLPYDHEVHELVKEAYKNAIDPQPNE